MRPLINDISRKKLNKLLGKQVEYKATFMRSYERGGKRMALLADVSYDGKLVADHVWVNMTNTLTVIDNETYIKFNAIAYTYTDSQKRRKNGLKGCRNYHIVNDGIDQAKVDDYQRFLRCRK